MSASVITRFAKNVRPVSVRRGSAALATTVVLAGGVQVLAATDASACEGPYKAQNATISKEARERHHNGNPQISFVQTKLLTLTAGGSAVVDVKYTNPTGADFEWVLPALTLTDSSGKQLLHAKDVTVDYMRLQNAWARIGSDGGCGGEAVRVDTSTVASGQRAGDVGYASFRITLGANAPKDLNSITVTTSASTEVGHSENRSTTIKVTHPGTKPAADQTPAKAQAAPAATPTAAPATTAPAGTPELAQTGASENNTFLAVSSAALLALGAGVLIAVRRLRPQR